MTPHDSRPGRRSTLVFVVTSHATAAGFLPGLAAHLFRAGWDVTVVCSPPDGAGPDDDLVAIPGVDVVTVPIARDPHPAADLRSARALWRILRDLDPDVVITATPKAGLLGTAVARLLRVPLVVHLMWGLRSETLTGPRQVLVRGLEGVATRYSHAVVPNSTSLAAELVRLRMARVGRVTVLGAGSSHGVDVERFGPRTVALADGPAGALAALGDGPVIGFVGRIATDKGVGTLLDAVEILRLRGCALRLFVIGSPEDQDLVRRIRAAGDGGAPVVLLEPANDLRPHYAAMDIHCLPTLREGFPNVCLEAAACEVPTVTTDATGAVDSVLPGQTGLVVPRGDARALADALETLLGDRDLRERMGRAARDWVVREFEAGDVCEAHAEHLRVLLRSRGTRGRRVVASPTRTRAGR